MFDKDYVIILLYLQRQLVSNGGKLQTDLVNAACARAQHVYYFMKCRYNTDNRYQIE